MSVCLAAPPLLALALPLLTALAREGADRVASAIADRFFGAPSAALSITGVTGTNGKTTVAWLLGQALDALRSLRDHAGGCIYVGTLGVGTPPEIPSWGNIIAEGRLYVQIAFWNILFPSIFLALMVLSINILGDGLRDMLDPRLARRI